MPEARSLRAIAGFEWLPVLAGLAILYVPTFFDLSRTLWQEDDFAHGPVVLAVIAWLIFDKRQVLLSAPARTAPVAGLASLVFGLLLYVVGRSQEAMFEVLALVPVLGGVLLAMRGWAALREMWFVLLFSVFLVPLPHFLVTAITWPLKQAVSAMATEILFAAGYPIAHDGPILLVGQYQLLVAEACSGINSMFSLSAVGFLYLYLTRRKSLVHNGLIVVSLLPIAFLANVVRVVFLVLLTYHFGDAAGQGIGHGLSGMVLFVVSLVVIVSLDAILARVIKPRIAVA
jgi:exosortase B